LRGCGFWYFIIRIVYLLPDREEQGLAVFEGGVISSPHDPRVRVRPGRDDGLAFDEELPGSADGSAAGVELVGDRGVAHPAAAEAQGEDQVVELAGCGGELAVLGWDTFVGWWASLGFVFAVLGHKSILSQKISWKALDPQPPVRYTVDGCDVGGW